MSGKLDEYIEKRDFSVTDEPRGGGRKSGGRLRFVVQHHIASRDHFDFRLEFGGVMLSWAVPKGPSFCITDKRLAVMVEEHPLEYRNFEGVIPKGEYGGGTVMLWDEGFWQPLADVGECLENGSLKLILHGKRLKGGWTLVRLKDGKATDNWLLIKERDSFSQADAGIGGFTTSIRTGRTMEEITNGEKPKKTAAKEAAASDNAKPSGKTNKTGAKPSGKTKKVKADVNPFEITEVQTAKLVTSLPSEKGWLFEMKYDGYRIAAYIENGGVRLLTRNGNDYRNKFETVANELIGWAGGRAMVLDGEMAVCDANGKTDFQALQGYLKKPEGKSLTYIVFDLLAYGGEDLRGLPLIKRKESLKRLMNDAPECLHYSSHIEGNARESLNAVCAGRFEGLIGKRADSVYSGTRNGDWIKLKCEMRQEFVIGGFTLSDKKTSGLSSLLLGYYDKNRLVYAGRAGTGFTEEVAAMLTRKFKGIKAAAPPFEPPPRRQGRETVTWLKPLLACEVRFAEWTNENLLRQASFKGLRSDKDVREIVREDK